MTRHTHVPRKLLLANCAAVFGGEFVYRFGLGGFLPNIVSHVRFLSRMISRLFDIPCDRRAHTAPRL